MTSQLLATELANLIQESKRKHNDLRQVRTVPLSQPRASRVLSSTRSLKCRQAAEKSLDELKSLRGPSEGQISDGALDSLDASVLSCHRADTAPELAQRPNFVNPFIIACGTKNVKFTGIAVVCLQRLIVSRALPRSRLSQVLEALQQATSAGLDVQLKILQALPSLLSNYSADVRGELLVTALNVCFILQSSKNAIVNNTSAATLQQLVVSVFDKVVAEDSESLILLLFYVQTYLLMPFVESQADSPPVGQVPAADGEIPLKAAAMDAYRVMPLRFDHSDLVLIRPGFP